MSVSDTTLTPGDAEGEHSHPAVLFMRTVLARQNVLVERGAFMGNTTFATHSLTLEPSSPSTAA